MIDVLVETVAASSIELSDDEEDSTFEESEGFSDSDDSGESENDF